MYFQADACHILLIPLNSTQEDIVNAQQHVQQMCELRQISNIICAFMYNSIFEFNFRV
jgi:hypothetical protein